MHEATDLRRDIDRPHQPETLTTSSDKRAGETSDDLSAAAGFDSAS